MSWRRWGQACFQLRWEKGVDRAHRAQCSFPDAGTVRSHAEVRSSTVLSWALGSVALLPVASAEASVTTPARPCRSCALLFCGRKTSSTHPSLLTITALLKHTYTFIAARLCPLTVASVYTFGVGGGGRVFVTG